MSTNSQSKPLPNVGDLGFALDAGVIGIVSVAICFAAHNLPLMTWLVPLTLIARMIAFAFLPPQERPHSFVREVWFFLLCIALGAFNDWNSVVYRRIYDYTVPVYFPSFSTIPIWMLLYWGMILRFLVTLFRWQRLQPLPHPQQTSTLGQCTAHPWAIIGLQLALIAMTRFCIYQFFLDPWLSWLPFAIGLATYVALFRLDKQAKILLILFALGGTGIEILYIQVGRLHFYHLGWLGGVPLWISLWWLLAVLIWRDLSARLLHSKAT